MAELTLASVNLHAGIDGFGRPFDVVALCRNLDADVLVLEENWTPDGGRSLAGLVADALGYRLVEATLATGRRIEPIAAARASSGPARFAPRRRHGEAPVRPIELVGRGQASRTRRGVRHATRPPSSSGAWGIALLSRMPLRSVEVLEVRRLRRDGARRVALTAVVECVPGPNVSPSATLLVSGTHLGHLRHGSLRQMRGLARELARRPGPGALLGDLNCWGPPVLAMFPGWRRAVKGPTWPAERPHHQLDHVLVRGAVRVVASEVLADAGSDHRPVRARLEVGAVLASDPTPDATRSDAAERLGARAT